MKSVRFQNQKSKVKYQSKINVRISKENDEKWENILTENKEYKALNKSCDCYEHSLIQKWSSFLVNIWKKGREEITIRPPNNWPKEEWKRILSVHVYVYLNSREDSHTWIFQYSAY